MQTIENLNPFWVWYYFSEIAKIPRPSKHEEKIIAYLINFAKDKNLSFKKDDVGNVLIIKPASEGKENHTTVILQSHMDMVCEKNSNTNHNFMVDPIDLHIEGSWVKAKGTTLGADDGIGIATMLAILDNKELIHGPLECLFTVDEETGLTGAFALSSNFLTGKSLINLDSEDEGELFIGCAGGIDTQACFEYKPVKAIPDGRAFLISITGLKGGHSGDEIHLGLGNAIRIMTAFLVESHQLFGLKLHRFEGGNLKNAIPREAFATIVIDPSMEFRFMDYMESFRKKLITSFSDIEPNFRFLADVVSSPNLVLEETFQTKLLKSLQDCPNGVIAWSKSITGLVETSSNLASIKFENSNHIQVVTSQRSSVDSSKTNIAERVAKIFSDGGAVIKHSAGYPGWEPNMNSELLKLTSGIYYELFHEKTKVKAIHAGLECGLFLEKYPDLDMLSFGPTIKGAHSPDERILISSVQKFWFLLIEVLKRLN